VRPPSRVARPSPDYVGGWKIADRGDSWIRLEAASWFMTAHLVLEVDDRHLSVATFICYDRPMAALVWPPLSAAHRFLMPGLLRHTVRAMRIAVKGGSEAAELRRRGAHLVPAGRRAGRRAPRTGWSHEGRVPLHESFH
jgi:hypothetical protein